MIQQYFDKHRSLAVGFMMAGYSVGYFLWPPLITVFFSHYGWRGGFIIVAGFQLNVCVLGALMRPFKEDKAESLPQHSSGGSWLVARARVFRNKGFLVFCTAQFVATLGYFFVAAYSPTIAKAIGESDTNAALLVSIYGK